MKIKTLLSVVAAASLTLVSLSSSASNKLRHDNITDSPARVIADGEMIDAMSTVVRHKDSVAFSFDARELTPGNAYTLWIMAFDKPKKCNDPCGCNVSDFSNPEVTLSAIGGMSGRVADQYGQARLATTIKYGEMPEGPGQALMPNPIKNKRSHFMLVLRDHGAASSDPVELEEQLSTWGGGCNTNSCSDVIMSDHKSPYCRVRN